MVKKKAGSPVRKSAAAKRKTPNAARKRAEIALRESEERHTFLLKLSDELRPIGDSKIMKAVAANLIANQLRVNRAFYAVADRGNWIVAKGFERGVRPLPSAPFPMLEHGDWIIRDFHAGKALVVDDMHTDKRFSASERKAHEVLDIGSEVAVPLVKNGALVAMLVVHSSRSRKWSRSEIKLIEETAERTWAVVERARAEAALRESEAKIRSMFETMIEACCIFDMIYDDRGKPVDWKILEANAGYERQSGLKDVAGKLASEVMPGTEPYWIEAFGRVAETGVAEQIEKWHQPTDRWIHSSTARVGGPGSRRLVSVFYDITERKRAEQRAAAELEAVTRLQRAGAFCAQVDCSQSEVLAVLLDTAVFVTAAAKGNLQLLDAATGWLKIVAHRGFDEPFLEFFDGVGHDDAPACAAVLAANSRVVIPDVRQSELLAGKPALNVLLDAGVQAVQSTPLISSTGRVLGVISTHYSEPHAPSERELGMMDLLARQAADYLERRQVEAALRASEAKYRTLFETMAQGYVELQLVRDETGRAVDWVYLALNKASERLSGIGVSIEKLLGQKVSTIYPDVRKWLETFDRISKSGEPERLEQTGTRGQWYEVHVYPQGSDRLIALYDDIDARKQAEMVLRQSEERQAFLLKVSDALRPLADPLAMIATVSEVVGRYLDAGRCGYGELPPPYDHFLVERDWTNGMPSHRGRWRLADFGDEFVSENRAGRTLVINDALADERGAGVEDALQAAGGLRASIGVPLTKNGKWVAAFFVHDSKPRQWTKGDVELVEEIAERTWAAVERARAEAALRESESRFQQFAAASSGALWVRDAATLNMEYASPAIGQIYGVKPDELIDGVQRWAAHIIPEDRHAALEHIERARRGESVVHEFRIQRPTDKSFRWIRDIGFPLRDNQGRIQRIGGIAEDISEAKLAVEHQHVLVSELQHRVRNIMAIIRSITVRTAERASNVAHYAEVMSGRLMALARVQTLLTRAANVGVGIASIMHDEVSAQAQHEGQYVLEGPNIELSPKAAEVLTLAVHELSTNALKYGALSAPNGKITVRWSAIERNGADWLLFDWSEEGAPVQPLANRTRREGFGSELIERRIPYELKGKGKLDLTSGGAHCHFEFPLKGGNSILETGAPQPSAVFGGVLEMTGETNLKGRNILIVEDDYYLATDMMRALQGAGANILGPVSTEGEGSAELDSQRPDGALLDINLGSGPSFKLASTLKDRGIPFAFITGYDQQVIPEEFQGVERLQKPVQLHHVLATIEKLSTRTP